MILVGLDTGEAVEARERTPHQFDGKGYTLQATGSEVPLYSLGLAAAEWATLEWLREHGAAAGYVSVTPVELSEDIGANDSTCRKALARLVKLGLAVKPSPRAAAYQLNPLRYWEGAGSTQVSACRRITPPRVTLDDKALTRSANKPQGAARSTPATRRGAAGERR
ncbi:MarR family transcriptional regulator [Streptomyces sp. AC627_RSS907]|uniref:MarR family transcriptional regulator n=1 Tax=Streptomyces sp. AC627_RSS907 TaxID=2823684 RepID=UPI001C24C40F|nr:MarR family transcriptional regulator [Streptomyces sp. AC627_RSS907]